MPSNISKELKELLKKMLTPALDKRLCVVTDVKAHRWFDGIDWAAVSQKRLKSPEVPKIMFPGDRHHFDDYPAPPTGEKVSSKDNMQFRGF